MRRLLSLVLLFWLCAPLALASGGGKKEPPKGPSYFELKPALVMNIAEGGKFVRCDVQLLINDPPLVVGVELHAPALRHELLMLLGEQDGNKLRTAQGKEELRMKALEMAKKVMKEQTGKESVSDLFFTAFFVQ